MKTYLEYLNEISEEDVLKGLLAHGLFADKIPPILNSEAFYDYYIKKGKPTFEKKGKDYVRYESMRNVNIPRLLSIPNPFAYANLCNCISCNWSNLQSFFKGLLTAQTYKVSRIHLRKMKDKEHLFEMNYKRFEDDKDPCEDIMIKNRYKVEADISNCFPSIYSHSIAWAILGKKTAKERRGVGEWCNELDYFVRNYNPQNHLAADNKTTCLIFPLKQKTKRLKKRSKQHTKSVIQMLFKSHLNNTFYI